MGHGKFSPHELAYTSVGRLWKRNPAEPLLRFGSRRKNLLFARQATSISCTVRAVADGRDGNPNHDSTRSPLARRHVSAPHHLQAAQRHSAQMLHTGLTWDQHYNWGLRAIDIEPDALANHRLVIRTLASPSARRQPSRPSPKTACCPLSTSKRVLDRRQYVDHLSGRSRRSRRTRQRGRAEHHGRRAAICWTRSTWRTRTPA